MPDQHSKLQETIKNEAFLWGDDVAAPYHEAAGRDMEMQWSTMIKPMLDPHEIDYSVTVDFACGRGRNTAVILRELMPTEHYAVDVNEENIRFMKSAYAADKRVSVVTNDGMTLDVLSDGAVSFFYTWDAMVHFDIELVISYIKEIARVLRPGGYGFIHHSNYTGAPGGDFRGNPSWRNFMSKAIFAHFAIKSGLEIVDQQILDWGGNSDVDCRTLVRKPE